MWSASPATITPVGPGWTGLRVHDAATGRSSRVWWKMKVSFAAGQPRWADVDVSDKMFSYTQEVAPPNNSAIGVVVTLIPSKD